MHLHALSAVAVALNGQGVDTEILHIGLKPLAGCVDCRKCVDLGKCVFNDRVNDFLEIADSAARSSGSVTTPLGGAEGGDWRGTA